MANRNVSERHNASVKDNQENGFGVLRKLTHLTGLGSKTNANAGRDARLIAQTTASKKHNRLTVERLEARMMFALDVIDANINELLNPTTQTSDPIVSNASQAPRITSNAAVVGGTTVSSGSAMLAVRATDNESATLLRYTWRMVSGPSGAAPLFSANNSNAAANTAVTFNRAGQYAFEVSVRDRSGLSAISRVNVNVVQVFSDLRVTDSSGASLTTNRPFSVASTSNIFRAVGVDQFDQPMRQQPAIVWSNPIRPSGSTVQLNASNNQLNVSFDRAGSYGLRAASGSRTFNVALNVASNVDQNSTVIQDATVNRSSTANRSSTINRSSTVNLSSSSTPVLTGLQISQTNRTRIQPGAPLQVSASRVNVVIRGIDQFGNVTARLPAITLVTSTAPANGTATLSTNSNNATISFSRAGTYTVGFRVGNRVTNATFNVVPKFTRLAFVNAAGQSLGSTTTTTGTAISLTPRALDQFGNAMPRQPNFTWTSTTRPSGSQVSFATSNSRTQVTFNRAGEYRIRANFGSSAVNITVRVSQALRNASVSPGVSNVVSGASQQFQVSATDQFGNRIGSNLPVIWSATGGSITSSGRFTAGDTPGDFRVTARIGTASRNAAVTVVASESHASLQDPSLTALLETYYSDGEISRAEMMQLIRSTVNDGTINATELADLRSLASTQSNYQMPSHVRELARSLVTSNPANLQYRGQALGNLVAGSTATHVNNLVDKWFLGTDVPTLVGAGISYRNATGSLFVGLPTISQSRQGALGNCYFIASMVSIAAKNSSAIQNMFIDNGDNTFTVRFFGGAMGSFFQNGLISSGFVSGTGVASYVTVNRSLPTFSNGTLAYSGMGLSATATSTPLWIALAEKAYAQWNELGKSGRDGTNRYAASEGGWMSHTNSQVLGYNSTNHPLSSTSKQTLINAINAGNAVTIGTNTSVGAGLVGGHAYVVTGYNAATDRFTLFNTWGNTHPAPLTWQQLQANCSLFVVTNPSGSVSGGAGIVRSAISDDVLAAVGVVDVAVAIADRTDAWDNDPISPVAGPMTTHVFCGYDESESVSSSTHNPTDLIVIASTIDSTGLVDLESWIGLQGVSSLAS